MNEMNGHDIEDLEVGMSAGFGKTITDADIIMFAAVSTDVNPVHLNEEYGSGTMFKSRIAHGAMTAGLVSAVLGNQLPGPGCIYMSQNTKFTGPVRVGDTVNTKVTVKEVNREKARVVCTTQCFVGDKMVLDGEAMMKVTRRKS
ncbi:MAG: MaoC family dehydratase [Gammaproteobacteria bacterium]